MDCTAGFECRFCLNIPLNGEEMMKITDEIKNQFENVTQTDLLQKNDFSRVICGLCLKSVQAMYFLKNQMIENQKKIMRKNSEEVKQQAMKKPNMTFEDLLDAELFGDLSVENDHSTIANEPLVDIEEEKENIGGALDSFARFDQTTFIGKMKSFTCETCGKSYSLRRSLEHHVKSVHKKLRYKCVVPLCPVVYIRKQQIKPHLVRDHWNLPAHELSFLLGQISSLAPVPFDN